MQRLKFRPPRRQRGITLIESLIAMIIAALGILGVVGVQMRTLTDTSTTIRRAQAIRLIEDFSERLKVNPNALTILDSYVSAFGATPTTPTKTCNTAPGCTNAEQAAYDLAIWKQAVQNNLPSSDVSLFLAPGEAAATGEAATSNRRQLGIMIAWRENELTTLSADDKKNIDATQVRDKTTGALTSGAGTAVTCPADRTCHLQYITVSARCAPYDNGSSSFTFHCS